MHACMHAQSLQLCPTFCDPKKGTVTHQAPPFMGFSRQGYWSELPCPPPEDLSYPGIELASPALQVNSSTLSHRGSLRLI